MMIPRERFYALRDSRTTTYSGTSDYRDARVVVSVDDAEAETASGQIGFLTAANLLARWCRSARFVAPKIELHPRARPLVEGDPLLGEAAAAIAAAADPYGDFGVGSAGRDVVDWHLHIGARNPAAASRILGRGWLALAGGAVQELPEGDGDAVLGAVLAACVGTAHAFRAAIGHPRALGDLRLSLWNLRGAAAAVDGPKNIEGDLARVHLIGCGAVGSAMAYLLPLARLRASGGVVSVDGDRVDVTNLNRAPLFSFADVGKPKVQVVSSYLRRNGFDVEECEKWFDEAVDSGQVFAPRPDVVIPAANDRGVRHSIQSQVPPLQVYGTTGRNWDAFLGRHIPLQEDCLACRFPAPVVFDEPPLACATAPIRAPGDSHAESVDAALPFLSTAAAVLGVAELVKATLEGFPRNPNFACLDFGGDLSDFVRAQRRETARCHCTQQRRVWLELNGRSRFAALTTTASAAQIANAAQPGVELTAPANQHRCSSAARAVDLHALRGFRAAG